MAGQPNMNAMLKQVQKMQADMAKAQEELKNEVVEASAGGGMVTVKISGELELKELRIDPEAVDPEELARRSILDASAEVRQAQQNLWRAQGRRVRLELKHFVRHVMTQTILDPDQLQGWRGEIREGQVVLDDAAGRQRERAERE